MYIVNNPSLRANPILLLRRFISIRLSQFEVPRYVRNSISEEVSVQYLHAFTVAMFYGNLSKFGKTRELDNNILIAR